MPASSLDHPSAHPAALRLFRDYVAARHLALPLCLDEDLSNVIEASDDGHRVPATTIIDALQQTALQTGRADIGLDFAKWASTKTFGPLTSTRQQFANLSDAIHAGARYLHLENAGLGMIVKDEEDDVALTFSLCVTPRYGSSQFIESVTLHALGMMRSVLGPLWSPRRIEFMHVRAVPGRDGCTLAGATVDHATDRNAIIISRSDLHRTRRNAGRRTTTPLDTLNGTAPLDITIRVEQCIAASLAGGDACLQSVAQDLAMTPRTLQRRLAAKGLTFVDVLDRARHRATREYFRATRHPNLLDLSHRLGFSDPSVTCRYLASSFGMGSRDLARIR